jgi:quercetin dioxygenase-like cupin family protein
MTDVLGRVVTIRRTERDPGSGTPPHRHPGSHTFGYVLEGVYEIKIDDGPVRRLGPGETFYEAPGQLHAVSRNGSPTQVVKYLVIQVSDPTQPQTVLEK